MHASLAVAFAYDRHLNSSTSCPRSLEECYHWSQGTALLRRRLEEPIETKDKDPIWGTAAALTLLAYSSPDASSPEDSWPLKPSGSSDLEWLRLSEGKMSLWTLTNPLRPNSIFRVMASTYADMHSPLPMEGTIGIPDTLASLCQLNNTSTADNNPYFNPAHAISQLRKIPDSQVTTGHTQLFVRTITGPFKSLLEEKDPVALLLLFLWYQKTSRSIWFIQPRAKLECPSICLYLQRYYGDWAAVHMFLPGGCLAGIF
jgi:hypothetical protein